MNSFNVFASYISVIGNYEVRFQLVEYINGVAFQCVETGHIEPGTYVEGNAKFAALDAFRSIFREMQPSFELKCAA